MFRVQIDAKGLSFIDRQEVSTRQSQKSQINASYSSMLRPVSTDITSASVLLCDTAVCFFCVPKEKYKQTFDFQMYRAFHLVLTLNRSTIQKPWRLGINQVCIHRLSFRHDKLLIIRSAFRITYQSRQPLATRSVPSCDSSSQCADCPSKKSGLRIRARYRHVETVCVHEHLPSPPTISKSSFVC